MNAANKAGNDLEFTFRGRPISATTTASPRTVLAYLEEGLDLSFYKNHDFEGAPGSMYSWQTN